LTATGRAAVRAADVFDRDRLLRDRTVVINHDTGHIAPAPRPRREMPPASRCGRPRNARHARGLW
jgi:hypothetical protein